MGDAGLVPIEQVRAYVLESLEPLAPAEVALDEALGCVLAGPLVAGESIPPFDCSAMDGFAVRSEDVAGAPVELRVAAATMAGQAPAAAVAPGEAVRVMTGAPIPPGADAVVMIELTSEPRPGAVRIESAASPGQYIRPAGDDLRLGDEVVPAGTVAGPALLGVAASLGAVRLAVHPRPLVGVISTGDELASGPGPLPAGAIRDSNRTTLAAALRQSGFAAVDLGTVRDDEEAAVAAVESAAKRCDAVVTSGGVSVGDRDVVKSALARLGGPSARWFQVAVQPAKPFAFARVAGGCPVFGLPGNPVSALVSFELFVRPALRRLAGHHGLERPRLRAVAGEAFRRRSDGKVHLVRARAEAGEDGRLRLWRAGKQGSHQLSALAWANSLAVLPDGQGVEAGGELEAMLLDAGELPPARPGGGR